MKPKQKYRKLQIRIRAWEKAIQENKGGRINPASFKKPGSVRK